MRMVFAAMALAMGMGACGAPEEQDDVGTLRQGIIASGKWCNATLVNGVWTEDGTCRDVPACSTFASSSCVAGQAAVNPQTALCGAKVSLRTCQ